MRYTLGGDHAAGVVILDGDRMRARYFNGTQAQAGAYVEALNAIEDVRLQREADERHGRASLYAVLKGAA